MKFLLLPLAAMLALTSACGGSSTTPTPVATTDSAPSIDPNLLPSIVLQASDLPPGLAQEGSFNPAGFSSARSFESSFTSGGLLISSSVTEFPDPSDFETTLDHVRRSLAKLIGAESSYQLKGTDVAFIYRDGSAAKVSSIAVRGRYVINIALQTNDNSAETAHIADLKRYTELVFGRLQAALADPSAVTPVTGVPTFDPRRLTPAASTTGTP